MYFKKTPARIVSRVHWMQNECFKLENTDKYGKKNTGKWRGRRHTNDTQP